MKHFQELYKENKPSVLSILRKEESRAAWSDQEELLGREGALKVGQNSLGKRIAGTKAHEKERWGDLETSEQLI